MALPTAKAAACIELIRIVYNIIGVALERVAACIEFICIIIIKVELPLEMAAACIEFICIITNKSGVAFRNKCCMYWIYMYNLLI